MYDEMNTDVPDPMAQQEALSEKLSSFVGILEAEAKRRVDKRNITEMRWLHDLQQYHGIYSQEILQQLEKAALSQVFINLTAPKTDTLVARLFDLLFPTDDRNYSVGPTPVPELTEEAAAAAANVDTLKADADEFARQAQEAMAAGNTEQAAQLEAQMREVEAEEANARAAHDKLQAIINEANRRAELMELEIEDQLVQCGAAKEARKMIENGCKIGMGVLKGPVMAGQGKKRWVKGEDGTRVLEFVQGKNPACHSVDPWSFFPDPDYTDVSKGRGCYERHLKTRDGLRRMAMERPDFDKDALREILRQAPDDSTPNYLIQLQNINANNDGDLKPTYHLWEYTGPIENEDMELLLQAFAPEGTTPAELDVLTSYHAKVWFCQGKVLSFALHPLDSNECIYSVFTVRPDEASPFGYGIPWIIRNPQSVLNAAFRMMMDNSALSTGPQIVVTSDIVEPQDGSWQLSPRKIWKRDSTKSTSGIPAFEAFSIQSNQNELANIIALSQQLTDDISGLPAIAQGEQGTGVTKTAQGMALLMNSANVIFRRMVRIYDDDVTVPMIRRFYDWNMQFSDKEEIKGDYEVNARGSGVLLVREMQAQNLLMIAQIFGDHPTYGPMIRHAGLLRAIFKAHMIPADEVIKSEAEYKREQQEQANQQDPASAAAMAMAEAKMAEVEVKREEVQARTAASEMEWAARKDIAEIQYQAGMERVAMNLNISREELEFRMKQAQMERDMKERALAAEIAIARESGQSAGGSV
jgi:hypothetical protein